jgi:hypothetical protein
MAVSVELQRRGVGAALVRVVCAEVHGPMWCNARLDAVGFYARMGWSAVGPVFDIGHHGLHQRMTWNGALLCSPDRAPAGSAAVA